METSTVENNRNAWIAVLNELFNSRRRTSLVSLGKISFEYLGNDTTTIQVMQESYNLTEQDAKNFLNFLVFEIVHTAAIMTDKISDIDANDKVFIFTPYPKIITKSKDETVPNSQGFRRLEED